MLVGFLSGELMFNVFFDRLCEDCMIFELCNYGFWCEWIMYMVFDVLDDWYCEIWFLFLGEIYCVMGCFYFNGVVVFLFEDISVELFFECCFCV